MCAQLLIASGDSDDIWTRHSWNIHVTRGHSGMAPVTSDSASYPKSLLRPGCALLTVPQGIQSSPCPFPLPPFPSFPSRIYLHCGLNHINAPHPSQSAGHGHSLSHALGVGTGSRQLPGAQGSQREGARIWRLDAIPSNLLGKLQREQCGPRATAELDVWPIYVLCVSDIWPIYIHISMSNICFVYVLYMSNVHPSCLFCILYMFHLYPVCIPYVCPTNI